MSNILLIGFRGCGKTQYGMALAQQTGRIFIDTDHLMVDETPYSIDQLHDQLGEEAFRSYEAKIVQGLKPHRPSVIATGGGVVLNSDSVAHLQTLGEIIYLSVPLDRLRHGRLPHFVESWETYYAARVDLYRSIADRVVNPEELAHAQ